MIIILKQSVTKSSYQLKCSLWPLLHKSTCRALQKSNMKKTIPSNFASSLQLIKNNPNALFIACAVFDHRIFFFLSSIVSCCKLSSGSLTYNFVLRESIDHQYDMIDQIHSTEKPESPFQIELEMSESASCSGSSSKPNRSSRFSRICKALNSTQCLDWAKRGQLD